MLAASVLPENPGSLEAGDLGALKGLFSSASVPGLSILKEWPTYDFPLVQMAVTGE